MDILNELLSNRRIPGEVKRIVRPIIPPDEVGKSDIIQINDELSTEEVFQNNLNFILLIYNLTFFKIRCSKK